MTIKKNYSIYISVIIIILVNFFAYFWWQNQLKSLSNVQTKKEFIINPGESISSIAKRLNQDNFIKNHTAFRLYLRLSNLGKKIQAGLFYLSPDQDAKQIAKSLTHGAVDIWITIPEGWRIEEIGNRLESMLGVDRQEFVKFAKEGYMFPDTYLIPKHFSAREIVEMMRENFNKRFNDELRMQLAKKGLTEKEIITIASLVEREAKFEKDRPIVAGILIKRLREDIPLQVDATIQYAIGNKKDNKTYWPKISASDLSIDSPYNTYKITGLPPAPIASPGLSSIKATIAYQATDYLYYLSDNAGKMHYAKTLQEHNQNITKFL